MITGQQQQPHHSSFIPHHMNTDAVFYPLWYTDFANSISDWPNKWGLTQSADLRF